MMDTTTRMRRKLAELNFDFSQFTMERFADYVGEFTGSEINFIGWDMPPGLFGAWVSLKDRASDYVFYDKNSPPILEIHTKLHELGHIINGHTTLSVTLGDLKEMIERQELNGLFKNSLLRSNAADQEQTDERLLMEVEAETLAELVQTEIVNKATMDYLTKTNSTHEKAEEYLHHLGLK